MIINLVRKRTKAYGAHVFLMNKTKRQQYKRSDRNTTKSQQYKRVRMNTTKRQQYKRLSLCTIYDSMVYPFSVG